MEGLSDDTSQHIGKLLQFKPVEGWGWGGNRPVRVSGPPPFLARFVRFVRYEEMRGGVAKIEQAGHPLDGHWVKFFCRHSGDFNFTTKPGFFTVTITACELKEGEMPAFNDLDAPPAIGGFSEIVAAL